MKIYINNKVYVSKKDILFILNHDHDLPASIVSDIYFQNNNQQQFIITDENQNDFLSFDSDEAKDYFRQADYILNFGSYAKYDLDYLYRLIDVLTTHRIQLLDAYTELSESDKIANMGLRNQIDNLHTFMVGLKDLIEIKENKSRIILPTRIRRNIYKEKEERAKEFLIKMMQPIKY